MRAAVPSLILMLTMTPEAFALYDDGARYAFMASASSKSISVIDLQEQALVHTIRLQRAPTSVTVSDRLKAVVIGHAPENRLTLIDISTSDLAQIDYPLSLAPSIVEMSPVGETVAIYDAQAERLEVHAFRRRSVLLSADNVQLSTDFTFSIDGAKIYWVDDAAGTFNSIDLWSERERIGLAKPRSGLSAMSRSIDGTIGFISEASANVVHMIDLLTLTPVLQVPVGSKPGRPWGTADGRYMLVPNNGDSTLTAISTATGESVYTVPAVDNAVSINAGWLDSMAAVVGASGQVAFIDMDDGKVTTRYELGGVPIDGIVTSDSRTLAVPVPGSGSLVFFDMQDRARVSALGGLAPDIGPAALAISNNLCH